MAAMGIIEKSIQHINNEGLLLVFPVKNAKDPKSLWSKLYPKSEMRWEWDEAGDNRVGKLWVTMKELSASKDVVYSKWILNRAGFFSLDVFANLHAYLTKTFQLELGLSHEAKTLLEVLREESPLSTKEVKLATDLQGKLNEGLYNKALKQLFERTLIVGFGEKEDGAFPSAQFGATELVFEDLCERATSIDPGEAREKLLNFFANSPTLLRQLKKVEKSLTLPSPSHS